MLFRSETSDDGKKLSICVEGKFDFKQRNEFIQLFDDHAEALSTVHLDLSKVSYIDSAACGSLIVLHKKASDSDVEFEPIVINSKVKDVFEILKLPLLFEFTLSDD